MMVVDIGINLSKKMVQKRDWKAMIRRAIDAGVHRIVLTGTSIENSRQSLLLAHEWLETEGTPNLSVTVGVHPHSAKSWSKSTLTQMKELLKDPLAVAVGECGLDYFRNLSSQADQLFAFREQVQLAHDLNYPIFVHSRDAHNDAVKILEEIRAASANRPKIVIHCFTGTKDEALECIQKGYYIGFTGTICKKERGAHLRELLPSLPLDRLMVETDTPYMGFKKHRRESEPADCVDVAKKLSESIHRPLEEVCRATTQNAMEFFGLPAIPQTPLPNREGSPSGQGAQPT